VAVFACVVVDGLIGVAWIVADPLKPATVSTEREVSVVRSSNGSVVDVVILQDTTLRCTMRFNRLFWFTPLHSLYIILALLLGILVILTRNIPQKRFNTQTVLRLDYVQTLWSLLVMCIYLTLLSVPNQDTLLFRFILFTVGINTDLILMSALLFFQPLHSTLTNIR
jgi:hypothetical protein